LNRGKAILPQLVSSTLPLKPNTPTKIHQKHTSSISQNKEIKTSTEPTNTTTTLVNNPAPTLDPSIFGKLLPNQTPRQTPQTTDYPTSISHHVAEVFQTPLG